MGEGQALNVVPTAKDQTCNHSIPELVQCKRHLLGWVQAVGHRARDMEASRSISKRPMTRKGCCLDIEDEGSMPQWRQELSQGEIWGLCIYPQDRKSNARHWQGW